MARIDVTRRPEGTVERFYELLPITNAIPDEPKTAAIAAAYEARLGAELETVVGTTRVGLDANSVRLRAAEANMGDFVADAIRADAGTDLVIMNSGSIRSDRVYPAGPIMRRTIVSIHPFGNVICKLAVPGKVVLAALNHGVAELPGSAGQFPQVSGLTMVVDPKAAAGDRVKNVPVNGQGLDPDKTYTIAILDFLLKAGDGYTMFAGERVLVGPEAGNLLVSALEESVAAKGEIAPQIDGRITLR